MPNFLLPYESFHATVTRPIPVQDYVIENFLVKGRISLISADPKAGKTTLIGGALRSAQDGIDFLGFQTKPNPKILYCTEEGPDTFIPWMEEAGIAHNTDFHVLYLQEVRRDLTWGSIVDDNLGYCLHHNLDGIVYDTLLRWANVNDENDASEAGVVMRQVERFRANGLFSGIVFHDRKSGGRIGNSSRGSNAYIGAADIVIKLSNPEDYQHSNWRTLEIEGRAGTKQVVWSISWEGDGYYRRIGDGITYDDTRRAQQDELKNKIRSILTNHKSLSHTDLAIDLGIDSTSTSYRNTVKALLAGKELVRTGRGGKGDPYTYALAAVPVDFVVALRDEHQQQQTSLLIPTDS